MRRGFYRCKSCCNVVAVEQGDSKRLVLSCACEGVCEFMGFVGRSGRLVDTEHRCPCDERCTNARGPNCDCSCGGKNHGSGAVVEVTVDKGETPRIVLRDPETVRARAAEYRAAREPFATEAKALHVRKAEVGWLSNSEYSRLVEINGRLARAHALKTHKARLKALAPKAP